MTAISRADAAFLLTALAALERRPDVRDRTEAALARVCSGGPACLCVECAVIREVVEALPSADVERVQFATRRRLLREACRAKWGPAADELRALRLRLGWTQADVAEVCRCTPQRIGQIERAEGDPTHYLARLRERTQ